jgi:hypothetical protein
MTSSRTSALVVVLLVATLAVPFGTTPAAASTQADCSNRVVYDAFRFDNATVDAAANGSATATAQNTVVRVEQATGFIRINATNPNGYCVEFRVNIAPSVVSPAELGDVDSNDGAYTAGWHAVRDLDRDEIYTQVVFTLPAGETASFAPSKLRVKSLAWTGTAKDTGGSWWESVSDYSFGEEEKLEKRTYRFSATNSTETITVSLAQRVDRPHHRGLDGDVPNEQRVGVDTRLDRYRGTCIRPPSQRPPTPVRVQRPGRGSPVHCRADTLGQGQALLGVLDCWRQRHRRVPRGAIRLITKP